MRLRAIAATIISASLLSGCAFIQTPTSSTGLLYSKVQGPIAVGKSNRASKTGRACSTNILGLVSTGDSSIDTAKKAGGINDIATVDHDAMTVLGVYGEFCTIVKGE